MRVDRKRCRNTRVPQLFLRDLPRLVEEIRAVHPGLEIQVTPPLDGHPALIDALLGRAREASEGKPGASETD